MSDPEPPTWIIMSRRFYFLSSDGGYLRSGKAKSEAHALCMGKEFNAICAELTVNAL